MTGTGIDPFAEGSKGDTVRDLTTVIDGVISVKDGVQFGRTDVYLDGRRGEVRSQETNLGNLSADANLFTPSRPTRARSVSIKNGGGIRDFDRLDRLLPATSFRPPPIPRPASRPARSASSTSRTRCASTMR